MTPEHFLPCPSTAHRLSLSSADDVWDTIIAPAIHKGTLQQSHLIKRATEQDWRCLKIDLQGFEQQLAADFSAMKSDLGIDDTLFPYHLSAPQWWGYALAPHSYLGLHDGQCQVGLNFFNRFLHLDLQQLSAQLVDPGIGNDFLATTNWFDAEEGALWFASWPIEHTARRIHDARIDVTVSIWKSRLDRKGAERVWQGALGDSLHQLAVCPAHRYVVLTELGLYLKEPGSCAQRKQDQPYRQHLKETGILPSRVLALDLQTSQTWRLSMSTAGHVEFDPEDPQVCYISGHNIGLVGPKIAICGPALIHKFRLTEQGPQLLGTFSRPDFHRITTHTLFRHRGNTLIGVTGYPGTIFLIHADSMTLFKTIEIGATERIDTSVSPHICQLDSYGIAASADGETFLVGSSGSFRRVDLSTGQLGAEQTIAEYTSDVCFTGHLGLIPAAIQNEPCNHK
ncbi:MAG: hypothetical protein E4H02_07525 [Lentisphaerales bacterium]|nr:MAG: hypothetical protein E4H02_07525 [Lentisphaerales bacterium]